MNHEALTRGLALARDLEKALAPTGHKLDTIFPWYEDGELVGVSMAIPDFHFCLEVGDLGPQSLVHAGAYVETVPQADSSDEKVWAQLDMDAFAVLVERVKDGV